MIANTTAACFIAENSDMNCIIGSLSPHSLELFLVGLALGVILGWLLGWPTRCRADLAAAEAERQRRRADELATNVVECDVRIDRVKSALNGVKWYRGTLDQDSQPPKPALPSIEIIREDRVNG